MLYRDQFTQQLDPKGGKGFIPAQQQEPVLMYRLVGAYENADSFRDFNKSESVYVAPSLTWNIGPQTTLNLFGEYQHYNYTFDRALPPTPETFRLPINRFLGEPGQFAHTTSWRAGSELIHHFNEDWQFRSAFAAIQSEQRSKFAQGFD